jgi:ketopantoate reductase
MELEAIVGAVIELGEMLDVPVPNTRAVYAAAKLLGEVAAGNRTV